MTQNFPSVSVKPYNGAPTIHIEQRPVFPLFLMSGAKAIEGFKKHGGCDIHLITECFSLGWVGIGKHDFAEFDAKMRAILRADPKAYIMPRLFLDAPGDWLDAYPDDRVAFADPAAYQEPNQWAGAKHPSWASRRWRADASDALRLLLRHAKESDYTGRIIGWHVGSGIYGEWHVWSGVHYPDTSPVFVEAYREWLGAKYPGEKREPRLPSVEDRRKASLGMFRDPAEWRWLLDHAEFFHQHGASALAEFAQIVREESGGRSIVLAFNGYLPDLGVDGHEIDHRAFETTLRDPNVHCFSAPHTYRRRLPGDDAMIRGYLGSVRAMGKLWIDEADDRTSLSDPSPWTHVKTMEESVEVLWRAFSHALTQNCGVWFMDMAGMGDHPSWYDHRSIIEALNQMQRIADHSMTKPRTRPTQLAVVASFKNAFYCTDRSSGLDGITDTLISGQLAEFYKLGAPFDLYLLPELFEPTVPRYDAYAFLDTFHMNDADYARVKKLRDAGKTLLFFYAPGIVSDTHLSLNRMRDLLGMEVEAVEAMTMPDGKRQHPGLLVRGAAAGVVRKNNVIWSPASPLAAGEMRSFFRPAGVHIYLDTDDVLMVGGGYVAVHASGSGSKTLRGRRPTTWINARTGKTLANGAAEVTLHLERGQTVLLEVGDHA
ncbi:MAG: hypothetical protein K8S99_16120 [Planctomycetes bacterium]|nr:hypothetical protein [Planctomycetota bacterium]